MTLIPTHLVNLVRHYALSAMTQTVSLIRLSRVSDGAGGWAQTEATLATAPCRVALLGKNAQEREIAASLESAVNYVIAVQIGGAVDAAGVQADDVLRLGDGREFLVISTLGQLGYEAERRIIAVEREA